MCTPYGYEKDQFFALQFSMECVELQKGILITDYKSCPPMLILSSWYIYSLCETELMERFMSFFETILTLKSYYSRSRINSNKYTK